jgi:hypothetical protein
LKKIERSELIWDFFVSAQCSKKNVEKYTAELKPKAELGADELLKDLGI